MNGSLQGELPHATAPDRSSVLVAARSLLWGCLGVVALGTVLSGVMARSGNARLVLTMSVFFGGALLSLLVFVGGYAFGSNPPG
ncbi:hypothetical protein [Microbacterium resistens]|uniref:hypothetical protein n=1 Tax=Microbacterium resistens TaxID=156977 RepID=UPI00286A289A|nr:hypothetical protein [Microbacterium resistens]